MPETKLWWTENLPDVTLEPPKNQVLVVVQDFADYNRPVLLLHKRKELFGGGLWNGPGGKCEPGETWQAAAYRELNEEVGDLGIRPYDIIHRGIIEALTRKPGSNVMQRIHIDVGQVQLQNCTLSLDLAKLQVEYDTHRWFRAMNLPFSHMWGDDAYWLLTVMLTDKFFHGVFIFDETQPNKVLKVHSLKFWSPEVVEAAKAHRELMAILE